MKDKIFENLREIQSLTYKEGNEDKIRLILIDIAHDVNAMIENFCDNKENVTYKYSQDEKECSDKDYENYIKLNPNLSPNYKEPVKFSSEEKMHLIDGIREYTSSHMDDEMCFELIKKVCEL